MSESTAILVSIFISGAATVWAIAMLRRSWHFLSAHFSLGGATILASVALFFVGQPLLWCVSLLNSFHQLSAPTLLGIGGAGYGLYYELYPQASALFAIIGGGPLLVALLLCTRRRLSPNKPLPSDRTFGALTALLSRLEPFVLLAAGTTFCTIFTMRGWDRLWWSPEGRFEVETTTGWLAYFPVSKVLMPLLLLIGASSAVLLNFSRRAWVPLVSTLLCLIPFAVFSSRGFSVMVLVASAALLWRFRLNRWLRILALVLSLVYALLLPLISRSLSGVGLKVFFQAHSAAFDSDRAYSVSNAWITLTQNASQGFPIVVEAIASKERGNSIVADLPAMYWILSISPTVSIIDGFGSNYVMYSPRVNYFTPFSAISMLVSLSYGLLIIFVGCVTTITVVMTRALSRLGAAGEVTAVVVVAAFLLGLIQSAQYDLRTAMRFFYASWEIGLLMYCLLRLHHGMDPTQRALRRPRNNFRPVR